MKFLTFSRAPRLAVSPSRTRAALLAFVLLSWSTLPSHAQVAKNAVREKIGGIDLVKTAGVTAAEVATALGKIKAATAYKRDGYFSIAGNLNEDIAAGDWTLYYTLDSAIAKVTTADVARVANLYLDLNQSVTGWFIPLTPPAAK